MWIVAIVCVAGFLLWQSNKRRAQRFVRSVCFLDIIDGGASADSANGQVARLFTKHSTADADNAAIRHAMDMANRLTDGKQLPWIHEARKKGFAIDSGDTRFDMAHHSQAQSPVSPDQKYSEHLSEGRHTSTAGAQFPHTPPGLLEAYHAGLGRIDANKHKAVPAIKAIARAGIRWALRGAVVGFVLGLFVPRGGAFDSLEVWAVPVLTAYLGAMAGLTIGAVYRVVRWVYAD